MDEWKQYKERLSVALKAAKICVFEVDLQRQLYTFFENAEAIFGVSGDKILSDVQPFSKLKPEEYRLQVSNYFSHPEDAEVIEKAFASIFHGRSITYEARMRAGSSDFVWCSINVTPIMEDGRPVKMIGVITDITDVKEKTDSLKEAARLDAFTGLYNKSYAMSAIKKALRGSPSRPYALILLDIDNFKNFNDTYGHHEGDKILQAVSDRLKSSFGPNDIIGRFGGDEFIVLVREGSNDQRLRNQLDGLKRYEIDHFICTVSMGVSFYPQDAAEFEILFRKADQALYRMKKRSRDAEL